MRIIVLLSTYNGEEYLEEQLDSILSQNVEHLDILIRDDESTDNTITIIKEYIKKYKNISFYEGQNIGSCRSYFDLIQKVQDDYDYYAFADQDDYWLQDKLAKAVQRLQTVDKAMPTLYCSNVIATDENLKPIKSVYSNEVVKTNFRNAVFENVAIGCSCVLNNKLLTLIKKHIPRYCYMHDWWCYISASYFGQVIYDCDSYILYRQHSSNVLGTSSNILSQYIKRMKQSKKLCHIPSMHMKALLENYVITEDTEFIQNVIRAKNQMKARMYLMKKGSFTRTRRLDTIMYKIRILVCGC